MTRRPPRREPDDPDLKLHRAAYRLTQDPELRPLLEWWRQQLEAARVPPGPVDPLRLVMAQGDRERLGLIESMAAAWERAQARPAG